MYTHITLHLVIVSILPVISCALSFPERGSKFGLTKLHTLSFRLGFLEAYAMQVMERNPGPSFWGRHQPPVNGVPSGITNLGSTKTSVKAEKLGKTFLLMTISEQSNETNTSFPDNLYSERPGKTHPCTVQFDGRTFEILFVSFCIPDDLMDPYWSQGRWCRLDLADFVPSQARQSTYPSFPLLRRSSWFEGMHSCSARHLEPMQSSNLLKQGMEWKAKNTFSKTCQHTPPMLNFTYFIIVLCSGMLFASFRHIPILQVRLHGRVRQPPSHCPPHPYSSRRVSWPKGAVSTAAGWCKCNMM